MGSLIAAPLLKLFTGRCAELTRADLICSGDQLGCSCISSAADPATWGVAMLVPWKNAKQGGLAQPKLGIDEYTLTPGAVTSGLILSWGCPTPTPGPCSIGGPIDENAARISALGPSVKNSCGVVPSTVTILGAIAAMARPFGRETMTAGMVG